MKLLNTGLAGTGVLLAVIAMFLALQAQGTATATPPAGGPALGDDLQLDVDRLRAEVAVLKDDLSRRAGAATERPSEPSSVDEQPADTEPEASTARDLLELGRKVIAQTATEQESARFWQLARTKDRIDGLLDLLQGEVDGAPRDVEARLRLADACIMKLFTVPAGPQMAHWSAKACDQWREVLKIDPDHWKARFSIAVSLSYHPDFAGKGPEAIRELEHLVEQQESMTPEPQHADVYRLLATLQLRRGDAGAAKRTLRLGLARHPDEEKIRNALEAIEK